MSVHQCIYCLQYKDDCEFNREHVVPRMMGRYQNGYVLNDFQVCTECNSYFCNNLENLIALDSYEALLRAQHLNANMSDGHRLRDMRIRLLGDDGIFKGIPFSAVTDQSNPHRIHFDVPPLVGIISNSENNEYDYYSLLELPEATEEAISRIASSANPIINTGIPIEELTPALIQKGYPVDRYKYSEQPTSELHQSQDILVKINVKIDSILRRVCAKTVFNYLCYSKGVEYVLNPCFDAVRKYIRNGEWSEDIWFLYSIGPVSFVELPNHTAHVVGYMWYPENGFWTLCGCLTWFGDITYIFKLGKTAQAVQTFNKLESTKMACFNNVDGTISVIDAIHVYEG